ncbi:unnamed protein product [Colias eurytheme]|nr:unnamed protein product [Colias eurytheme]
MDGIKNSVAQMSQMFKDRMDDFQRQLDKSPQNTGSPNTNLSSEFFMFRGLVMTSLQCLQSQVDMLSKLYDKQEMRSRRKILLVHGVPETQKENTANIITKALSEHGDIGDISKDLSECHRIGRTMNNKPRPVLIKFRVLEDRNRVWFSKTNLKGSGITISEFLTKPRHDTFMAARQRFGISNCWTKDGLIFISSQGKRYKISSQVELETIPVPASDSAAPCPARVAPQDSNKDTVAPNLRTRRAQRK